jgi:6-pyruvoyltetrahydropterin/6-carboxytetrahydropterin synthase
MEITKRFYFSASHRLINKTLSKKENIGLFNACFQPHGHNFVLDVTVEGNIAKRTGMVINFHTLKEIVVNNVLCCFDHKDFDANIPEFKNKVQTAENLAIIIWGKLKNRFPKGVALSRIRISETNDNWVEYSGK